MTFHEPFASVRLLLHAIGLAKEFSKSHFSANTHAYSISRHSIQSRPQTLKQFAQFSSPSLFSMLLLLPNFYNAINIERGIGVFQGFVAEMVATKSMLPEDYSIRSASTRIAINNTRLYSLPLKRVIL